MESLTVNNSAVDSQSLALSIAAQIVESDYSFDRLDRLYSRLEHWEVIGESSMSKARRNLYRKSRVLKEALLLAYRLSSPGGLAVEMTVEIDSESVPV